MRVATLMLGTRFLASVGREGLWNARVVRSYRDQWKAKHAETVQRLAATDVELASYTVEDVRSWLQRVPREAPVCSFPPFYGGGYEKLYEPLDTHFTWDAPEYELLSDADADVVDVLGAITCAA
ncbi:putative antirestriction adenine methyltransferase [Streptomyces milbemycinicus]|uniref:putative antirestriction adenine methyltransferase n=1 Tax=Streptomyces milbemycinicus TaxID=476552 RepID=UPI003F4CBB95